MVFKQWPIPLVAATALIVLLFAQRFGISVGLPAFEATCGPTAPQVRSAERQHAGTQRCNDLSR